MSVWTQYPPLPHWSLSPPAPTHAAQQPRPGRAHRLGGGQLEGGGLRQLEAPPGRPLHGAASPGAHDHSCTPAPVISLLFVYTHSVTALTAGLPWLYTSCTKHTHTYMMLNVFNLSVAVPYEN